jgi:hypothetical protein
LRRGPAHAAAGAGDQGHFAVEPSHVPPSAVEE